MTTRQRTFTGLALLLLILTLLFPWVERASDFGNPRTSIGFLFTSAADEIQTHLVVSQLLLIGACVTLFYLLPPVGLIRQRVTRWSKANMSRLFLLGGGALSLVLGTIGVYEYRSFLERQRVQQVRVEADRAEWQRRFDELDRQALSVGETWKNRDIELTLESIVLTNVTTFNDNNQSVVKQALLATLRILYLSTDPLRRYRIGSKDTSWCTITDNNLIFSDRALSDVEVADKSIPQLTSDIRPNTDSITKLTGYMVLPFHTWPEGGLFTTTLFFVSIDTSRFMSNGKATFKIPLSSIPKL
jgi:hypothetical protein